MASVSATLEDSLSECLPQGLRFKFNHVSTPPLTSCAIYTPPSGISPERTYCESHLLLVSHISEDDTNRTPLAIFALEVLIYTTVQLTTVFVSKADSTGFAAHLPATNSSTLRSVASAFVSHLIQHRLRKNRRLVLSLFARSQDQYLFPGSIENKSKHVLSDRQLVSWWCRTLDPVLRRYPADNDDSAQTNESATSEAYLVVPGYDSRETFKLFPSTPRTDGSGQSRWHNSHPLHEIAPYDSLLTAPRSLIPHFPDDPKSRFLLDLDDEISDAPNASQPKSSQTSEGPSQQPSPSKRGNGMWKSVKSIEQFWEMMAWRQECSSGRLVGFLWITFTPRSIRTGEKRKRSDTTGVPDSPSLAPAKRRTKEEESHKVDRPRRRKSIGKQRSCKLKGVVVARIPRVKSASKTSNVPEKSKYFYWPSASRGDIIVDEKAYQRIHEIMLRLDFAGSDAARASTGKWVSEVAVIAGKHPGSDWGMRITGKASHSSQARGPANGSSANTLNAGLVRKRGEPRAVNDEHQPTQKAAQGLNSPDVAEVRPAESKGSVNMLDAGLVRKKAKA